MSSYVLQPRVDRVASFRETIDDLKKADPRQTDSASDFDLNRFDELLSRLEASKGRQQRQKSVEGRRDIFQQGLASMMSNF